MMSDNVFPLPNITSRAGPEAMTCVYAVSGQYGLLPRVLYYALLIFTVFTHRYKWLVAGAAASAMTFSGSAAIHAIILVALPRSVTSPIDLDVFGAYAASATGLIFIIPIMSFSKSLRTLTGRVLIRVWGVLMFVGTACAITAMWRPWAHESPCVTKEGNLLTSMDQLDVATFNCTYSCFDTKNVIRGSSDVIAIPVRELNNSAILQLFICALGIGLLTCSNLIAYFAFSPRAKTGGQRAGPPQNSSCMFWIYMSATFFSPFMFLLNISSIEAFFRSSKIPISEQPNLVGQWSVVMGAGLVIVAAAINKWVEHKESKENPENGGSVETAPNVQTIHHVNNGQYKWEPGTATAPPEQGIPPTFPVRY
jgi:hypothetical protein